MIYINIYFRRSLTKLGHFKLLKKQKRNQIFLKVTDNSKQLYFRNGNRNRYYSISKSLTGTKIDMS